MEEKQQIRFIDSRYRELFRINDGDYIQLDSDYDGTTILRCFYADDYHTNIGNTVFHISEFAEKMENTRTTYQPEMLSGERLAFQIGGDHYLIIQKMDDGYDFTLFDDYFVEIDGGIYDDNTISFTEARLEILTDFGLEKKRIYPVDYDYVLEKAEEVEAERQSLEM